MSILKRGRSRSINTFLQRPKGVQREVTKIETGNRVLPVGSLLQDLQLHFKLQRKHITFLGSPRKDQKLVFPSSRGTPLQADYPEKACKQIFTIIGLDNSFTFHNLRHTATSIMLNNGMFMVEVSKKYLGHSSPTITAELYAHVINACGIGESDWCFR